MRAGDHRLGLSVLARVGPGVEGEARSFEVGVGPAKEGGGQTPPEARDWGSRGGKGVAAEAGEVGEGGGGRGGPAGGGGVGSGLGAPPSRPRAPAWRRVSDPRGLPREAGGRLPAGRAVGVGWESAAALGLGGDEPRAVPAVTAAEETAPGGPGAPRPNACPHAARPRPRLPGGPPPPRSARGGAGGVRCGHVCCRRGRGSPLSQRLCAAPYSRVPGSRRGVPPGLGTRESGGTRPAVSPPSAALSPVAAGRDLETPPPRPPPPGSHSRPEGVALSRRCPRSRSLLAEPVPPTGPGSPVPAPVACANVPDITMGWGRDKERRRNTRCAEPALPAPPTGRRPEGSLNASRAARPHPHVLRTPLRGTGKVWGRGWLGSQGSQSI